MKWRVEQVSENVHLIRIPYRAASSWRQYVLLSADRHHDSPKTRQDLEEKHLKQALERQAPIIDVGDIFDAMQGRRDRRQRKSEIRPEHMREDYLDALVEEATEFYGPYKELFTVIGRGNHDESIRFHHEVDLTGRLCRNLGCFIGGYRGWVRFLFERAGGGARQSVTLHYVHGPGGSGGGEVTKGILRASRRAVILPDADIVASGHVHESWIFPIERWRLGHNHRLYRDTQYHVQIPTYKDEFETGASGWVNEREMPPKPLGAWWIKFEWNDNQIRPIFVRAD